MSWFFLSLAFVLSSSIANIFRKILLRDDKNDVVTSAIIFQFLSAAIVGFFALLHGFVFPPLGQYPLNFLLVSILWGTATVCIFKAYQYIEASEVTIIGTLQALVIIVAATILIGERFTLINAIGALLIILSVVFIIKSPKKLVMNKGVIFALLYCLLAGFASTNDAFLLHHYEALSYLTVNFILSGTFVLLVTPKSIKKIKPLLHPTILKKNIIFSFFYAVSGIAYFLAIAVGGQVSQVGTIGKSSVVLTVILATLFLNEDNHFIKKIICAIVVTVGVFLLR